MHGIVLDGEKESIVVDLQAHTLRALDWPVITTALSTQARTLRGQSAAKMVGLSGSLDAVHRRFQAVMEVDRIESEGERIPLGGIGELRAELERAVQGEVLEIPELQSIRDSMVAMSRLETWLQSRKADAPELCRLIEVMFVDTDLRDVLCRSFDSRGELCGTAWPELGALRVRIRQLRDSVRGTLDRILRASDMEEILQDHYITEREGRLVIPVRAGAPRRGLGIVHGTSQSGETLFVEPAEVVVVSNDIREKEAALQREILRILGLLTRQVGRQAEALERSLVAVARVDLAVARWGLGRSWKGTIPTYANEGTVDLRQARHPVLVLRGLEVVANDLGLDGCQPGLILSGPNTGGKTVALKTLGLCALLLRAGIPLPVAEGSRLDLMNPIVADIGDIQTVEGDLSTFSGHLLVLKKVLEQVGPGALVLLDEVGMGTDPAQGAALAQAFLEAIVDRGARLVTTTHYAPLRALSAVDERFAVAAVEVCEGRPSYRLRMGETGASHAFTIARGLDIPEDLVERARSLMDHNSRQVSELVEALEIRRGENEARRLELQEARNALEEKQRKLLAQEAVLDRRRTSRVEELAADFAQRLKAKEDDLKKMIAAMQEDPGLREAGALLQRIRETRESVAQEVSPEPPVQEWLPLPSELSPGDRVRVKSLGKDARVMSLASRGRVEVEIGSVRMQVKKADLSGTRARKESRPRVPVATPVRQGRVSEPVRTGGNTLDLRGYRLDEAIAATEQYCDRMRLAGHDSIFLLHGHGTGALKSGLREWARSSPHGGRYRPGQEDEGGDAFTVLFLDP